MKAWEKKNYSYVNRILKSVDYFHNTLTYLYSSSLFYNPFLFPSHINKRNNNNVYDNFPFSSHSNCGFILSIFICFTTCFHLIITFTIAFFVVCDVIIIIYSTSYNRTHITMMNMNSNRKMEMTIYVCK